MNGRDIIALLEYTKAFKKDPKPSRKKAEEIDWDTVDFAQVYLKLAAKAEKIKKDMEQVEKLMKKEEKKDDKKGSKFNPMHVAMWMLATAPITGPLMLYYWAAIFTSIRSMH
jgi:hypothetical protein